VEVILFTRRNIYERDNGKCIYCGNSISFDNSVFVHITLLSEGGKTDWNNIATSCVSCCQERPNLTNEEAWTKVKYKPFNPNKETN